MTEDSPLKYYRQFITELDRLLSFVEFKNGIITEGVASEFHISFHEDKIYEDAEKARAEIGDLVFTDNNNAERLVREVCSRCDKINQRFREITTQNELIAKSENLSINEKQEYFNSLTVSEKKIYMSFTKIAGVFASFYRNSLDLMGKPSETITGNQTASREPREKIKWLGDQKQLGELIVELERKKWIGPISPQGGRYAEIARSILQLFDVKGKVDSFIQIMKPVQKKENSFQPSYPQIFTKRYKRKFHLIELNKTEKGKELAVLKRKLLT